MWQHCFDIAFSLFSISSFFSFQSSFFIVFAVIFVAFKVVFSSLPMSLFVLLYYVFIIFRASTNASFLSSSKLTRNDINDIIEKLISVDINEKRLVNDDVENDKKRRRRIPQKNDKNDVESGEGNDKKRKCRKRWKNVDVESDERNDDVGNDKKYWCHKRLQNDFPRFRRRHFFRRLRNYRIFVNFDVVFFDFDVISFAAIVVFSSPSTSSFLSSLSTWTFFICHVLQTGAAQHPLIITKSSLWPKTWWTISTQNSKEWCWYRYWR